MPSRMLRIAYRLIRRVQLLDVVQLMHLPIASFDRTATDQWQWSSRYSIDLPTADELRRALQIGTVGPDIGNPDKLESSRQTLVIVRCRDEGPAIIAFLWLCREQVLASENFSRALHLGTSLTMPPGCAFIYNAWTAPQHRGRGLVAAMLAHVIHHTGYSVDAFLTTMDWTNDSSRRAFAKIGMHHLGYIWRCGGGVFQFSLVPKLGGHSQLQIAASAPGLKLAI